ncbi:hypothetical protein E2C01_051981 [Portunus trituberculatus]|uniref:Uncharacterized protein n=1 Tax=Portunus trituberculatus TaxID=210409 RepID=A0A5B7GK86_PORTR|nr:hypothetical protein [Portunus trituberculatus]
MTEAAGRRGAALSGPVGVRASIVLRARLLLHYCNQSIIKALVRHRGSDINTPLPSTCIRRDREEKLYVLPRRGAGEATCRGSSNTSDALEPHLSTAPECRSRGPPRLTSPRSELRGHWAQVVFLTEIPHYLCYAWRSHALGSPRAGLLPGWRRLAAWEGKPRPGLLLPLHGARQRTEARPDLSNGGCVKREVGEVNVPA